MTETPAAAVAAPAAPVTPAAPAVAPVAPVTPPAVVAAPVAAPAAVAPLVEPPVESLIPADPAPPVAAPQTEVEKIAAARELIKQADAAADPNSGKAWLLTEGVMGQGEKPVWLKGDKYKTVADQAAAYPELEKRFGSFTGAPKDGKYEFKPPEGVDVKTDHPLMQKFTQWATEKQLSAEGYNDILGMLVQYEAAHQPNMGDIKGRLGADADARISNVSAWMKANLGAEGFANFRASTTGANADAVFKTVEALIGKSGQVKMPKPGGDVPGATGGDGLDAIKAAHGARMPDGKFRKDVDPAYAAEIDRRYREYFASAQA